MAPLHWSVILTTFLLPAQVASGEPSSTDGDCEVVEECRSAEEIGAGFLQLDNRLHETMRKVNPLEAMSGGIHFPEVPQYFQTPAKPDLSILPVAWLHLPKGGSSFLNAIIRLPGVCHGLPDDIIIEDHTMGPDNINGFFSKYPMAEYCSTGTRFNFFPSGGHYGVGTRTNFERMWKGRGITTIRIPEQRLISAFFDNAHSWPLDAHHPVPSKISIFAKQVQGCAVKMLTRSGVSHPVHDVANNGGGIGPHWGGPCGRSPPPSKEEVAEAHRRLRTFLFVGLQEEWELSMCLFHATFGGPCHRGEFINTRHEGRVRPKREYNEDYWLDGWKDPYDGPLYKEGEALFWSRFRTMGLSVEACKPCFDQANYTYEPSPDI